MKGVTPLLVALGAATTSAFVLPTPGRASTALGPMVQVRFRILPDGTIEETVVGAKGKECLKVTEELNKRLGKVLYTEPTAEMYEKRVTESVSDTEQLYESKFSEW